MLPKEIAAWKWGLENIPYQPQRINYKKKSKKRNKKPEDGTLLGPPKVSSRIKGLFK